MSDEKTLYSSIDQKVKPTNRDTILVIGGGRWSRQYLISLSRLVSPEITVQVFTINNKFEISKLITKLGVENNFKVIDSLDDVLPDKIIIAFVVNKAKDHFECAKFLILKKISILIEKPLTLNTYESKNLINLAQMHKTILLYSNILFFTASLRHFVSVVSKSGEVDSINIIWHDAIHEIRYGEQKRYDNDLTVMKDIMPHIACILTLFRPGIKKLSHFNTSALQDRTSKIDFKVDDLLVHCDLSQQSSTRSRIISVLLKNDEIQYFLDFTISERSKICSYTTEVVYEEYFISIDKPLELMIKSAINSVNSGVIDPQLTPATDKYANLVLNKFGQ